MLVQAGLCRTCSETTLLVFPRGGSNLISNEVADRKNAMRNTNLISNEVADRQNAMGNTNLISNEVADRKMK